MKYRFFSIPVQDGNPAADELNRFLAAHRVVAIDREFAADGRHSLWCFSVSYLDGDGVAPAQARGKVDYREVDSCFACRSGKGPLAAVHRVQSALRRYPWYVKIDIRGYFAAIDQARLLALLGRRFKGAPLLDLFARIVATYRTAPGKGLPIGTLSSQFFANYYLDGLDRLLLERLRVLDHARYMDDVIWWCADRAQAHETLRLAREFAAEVCLLEVKESAQINRSTHGVAFLGFRVRPGTLRLSHRRRRSFLARRRHWEREYRGGRIDAAGLQRAYAAVHGITAQADSRGWRAKNLARHPPVDA